MANISEKIFEIKTIQDKIEAVHLEKGHKLPSWVILAKHGKSKQYSIYADNHGLHIGYLDATEDLY